MRDGYRCVVTGQIDVNSVRAIRGLLTDSERRSGAVEMAHVQVAHIFPRSTNVGMTPSSREINKKVLHVGFIVRCVDNHLYTA